MFRAQSNIFDDVVVKATDENLTSENWEYILVRLFRPPTRSEMWELAPWRAYSISRGTSPSAYWLFDEVLLT
jgi:hypothetical protein